MKKSNKIANAKACKSVRKMLHNLDAFPRDRFVMNYSVTGIKPDGTAIKGKSND